MDINTASLLIKKTFSNSFDKTQFISFIKNLLNEVEDANFHRSGNLIKHAFMEFISSFERIGKFKDNDDKEIDILIVKLKRNSSIERARSAQRNFIANHLSEKGRSAALVAFVNDDNPDWRFSLVKMDYAIVTNENGKARVKEEYSSARRWSFLVGKNENSHTAQERLVKILANDKINPNLKELEEAFNVEKVSNEFFDKYKDLYLKLSDELERIVENDEIIKANFEKNKINLYDFSKKLLGQIVFLYFLQKKGWLGVQKNEQWGQGSKNFMRDLFERCKKNKQNYFNDYLEPLFYEALRLDRSHDDHYYRNFDCKIPFLNGGLFDPINGYDWVNTDIVFDNSLFSNKISNGDGDGILDIFDLFNFTVKEDEPLEKEVAVDPEMLGKVFERLLEVKDRKAKGAFYTPREIVHYMCAQSLIYYLESELKDYNIPLVDIEYFINKGETSIEIEFKVMKDGETETYKSILPKTIQENAKIIDEKLKKVKICDPAIGSGAFPVGMLSEVVKARRILCPYLGNGSRTLYSLKRECIENSLYGVDIDLGAVEIAKLRLWLSLVVDEDDINDIQPLPNLDYKIMRGNSLISFPVGWSSKKLENIENLKHHYFNETNISKKREIKSEIDSLIYERLENSKTQFPYTIDFDFRLFFSELYTENNSGFDIMIGNPPYVSNKGTSDEDKKAFNSIYGFSDDLYNYFYINSHANLKDNGVLAFITSNTFLTINSKINLRKLFQSNLLRELIRTDNVFDVPMVEPAIVLFQKQNTSKIDYQFSFKDAFKDFKNPEKYLPNINIFRNAPNKVFLMPSQKNINIYEKYNSKLNQLFESWWDKISTSKNITKFKLDLEHYRKNLKAGDITLLGLITEGGQGLATANNGKFVAALKGTKTADNILKSRPEKLLEVIKKEKINKYIHLTTKNEVETYLNSLEEKEIWDIFDQIKLDYKRDVFGQGYLFRIIEKNQIACIDDLTDEEKKNGIGKSKPSFVLYDKGDKDGNRWYLDSPFYIDWSKENVKILQTDSKARWQGNKFFFKEGLCWSDINTIYLKCRLKNKSVNDVKSMSMFSLLHYLPDWYFVCIINSKFISEYVEDFINNTQTFQINDARQLPIVIPTTAQLKEFEDIFNKAFEIKKKQFSGSIGNKTADKDLALIQVKLDNKVLKLYGIESEE